MQRAGPGPPDFRWIRLADWSSRGWVPLQAIANGLGARWSDVTHRIGAAMAVEVGYLLGIDEATLTAIRSLRKQQFAYRTFGTHRYTTCWARGRKVKGGSVNYAFVEGRDSAKRTPAVKLRRRIVLARNPTAVEALSAKPGSAVA
jgi:hypothetical protein